MKKVTLKALVQTVKRFQECFTLLPTTRKKEKENKKIQSVLKTTQNLHFISNAKQKQDQNAQDFKHKCKTLIRIQRLYCKENSSYWMLKLNQEWVQVQLISLQKFWKKSPKRKNAGSTHQPLEEKGKNKPSTSITNMLLYWKIIEKAMWIKGLTFNFFVIKWGILVELKPLPSWSHALCCILFSCKLNIIKHALKNAMQHC